MKVEMVDGLKVIEEFGLAPHRERGRWARVCERVAATGKAALVRELSRGQAYYLRRIALRRGLRCRVLSKPVRVIILSAGEEVR